MDVAYTVLAVLAGVLACAVLVLGVRCRAAKKDPELYYARLAALRRVSVITVWTGMMTAFLSLLARASGPEIVDPMAVVAALAIFWVDLGIERQVYQARSLLLMYRIDNGTYRPDDMPR